MKVELQISGRTPEIEIPEEVVNSPGFRVPNVGECLYGYGTSDKDNTHAVDDVVWDFKNNTVTLILEQLDI